MLLNLVKMMEYFFNTLHLQRTYLGAQEELDDKLSILGYLLVEYYRILVTFVTPTHHRGLHATRRNQNIVQNLLQKADFAYSSSISSGN